MKSTILLHCVLILWIVCWCSLGSANEEGNVQEDVQDQITATIMTEMMMNQRNADFDGNDELSREDTLNFARTALGKVKDQEKRREEPVAEDDNISAENDQSIDDITFTAKERVTRTREEQQRLDAEMYLRKGIFELMVDQMKNDLSPFLLLIPPPVKTYIRNASQKLATQGKSMLTGALFPMAMSGIRVARVGVDLVNGLNTLVHLTTQKAHVLLDQVEENFARAHEARRRREEQGDSSVVYSVVQVPDRDIDDGADLKEEVEYDDSLHASHGISDSGASMEDAYGEEVIEL